MITKRSHIGEVTDNQKCPECDRKHDCDLCDDWHYCDCGYWWSQLDGKTIDHETYENYEVEK